MSQRLQQAREELDAIARELTRPDLRQRLKRVVEILDAAAREQDGWVVRQVRRARETGRA